MIGLIIDAAVIGVIIAVMESDEFPGWGVTILCALAISVSTWLLSMALPGLWALLGIVGGAVVGAFVISALCGMSLKRAGIAASIFLVYRIAISFLWAAMFS